MARNMVQFQKGLSEPAFERQFGTEEQCRAAVVASRWPDGFICPECGGRQHSLVRTRDLFQCSGCRRQTSPIAGTLFAATKLPLRTWFRAIYHMTQTKQGISSIELGRRLGVRQNTAWTIKHKLKQAMMERDASKQLSGRVEIDDAYMGGERTGGKRGRGAPGKTPFVAAVETTPEGKPVRIKLGRVEGFSGKAVSAFARRNFHPGCTVVSDGLQCFGGVTEAGCAHEAIKTGSGPASVRIPTFKWVNTALGNIKAAITGTYRSIASKHVPRYLAEFEYRFNRRYDLAAMVPRLCWAAWDAITRLTGPRALRLREILDPGADIGLMRLRPVWLMNPDVASRMLPLKTALFDLVIFDEASQMPVEHAVPSLFRARRAVISGDDKQMPPSSFFSARVDGDDGDKTDIENFDDATETERAAQADAWNRRDVQSCPDLLQLGRSVLPTEMLQIHYRSKYRELIDYSNGAFYKNSLNVPARHPDDEVRRVRPIEVIRVDGTYEGQTNAAEAGQVVETLIGLWAAEPNQRPSVGVVTFNRKQADLVDEAIEKRAAEDPAFLQALQRERERTQNGEDMGFFVKNVENVQGDERDIIIFSTTFGRDAHGTFRRFFGVLGQAGGERRLNVAVTRARDKVVLLTSMPIKDVSDWLASKRRLDKPRDYLQAYLEYASKVSAGDLDAVRGGQARFESGHQRGWKQYQGEDGFAASVAAFIRGLGHQPVAGNDNDNDMFRLDFAIENSATGQFGIGIECDAPRHSLLAHARAREIWRPAVLARSVPVVHRVSSHAWYSRGEEERSRLRTAIEIAVGQGRQA